MRFSKKGNIYKIMRATGNQSNILGISFADKNSNEDSIQVIEWDFPKIDNSVIRTSKEEVLQQVLLGLKLINEDLGTNYQLSKIYYVPSEDGSLCMYQTLLTRLIRHYHSGNEFEEKKSKN